MATIYIDPGHGGRDVGALNGSRCEKDDTLLFSKLLKQELEEQGMRVWLTRSGDNAISLAERVDAANKQEADLFLSVHRNSFTADDANGVETWIYRNASTNAAYFARLLMEQLAAVGIQKDRGVKKGDYYVTRKTTMPACLLELGFLSNDKDNELFDQNLSCYVLAVARAICRYFGICYQASDDIINRKASEDGAACKLYRVQVGCYKKREQAEKTAQVLREQGFHATVL